MYVTDSSNARTRTASFGAFGLRAVPLTVASQVHRDDHDSVTAALADGTSGSFGNAAAAAGLLATSASFSFRFIAPTVAGTYTFRIFAANGGNSYTPVATPLTYPVTVTANTSTAGDAAKSQIFLNRTTEYTTSTGYASNAALIGYRGLEADSALVVSAGTAASPTAVGVISPIVRNSSDTRVSTIVTNDGSTASAGSLRVKDSVTVTITGPGLLGVHNYWTG